MPHKGKDNLCCVFFISTSSSAADVVFLDEGLSTIITAIKVSRQIFHRKTTPTFELNLR